MKRVKFAAFALAATLLFTQDISVISAEEVDRSRLSVCTETMVTPFWVNTSNVSLDVTFSNGKAQCSGKVVGDIGTSKIDAIFTLERKNSNGLYSFETSWTESVSGRTLTFSNNHAVSSGYIYRLSVSTKVTKDGITETVNTSVESKY